MRIYVSSADFTKIQTGPRDIFARTEFVVFDNINQPIYVYNSINDSFDLIPLNLNNTSVFTDSNNSDQSELTSKLSSSLTGKTLYLEPRTYTLTSLISTALTNCAIVGVPGVTKITGNFGPDAGGGTINTGILRLLTSSGVRFYGIIFENTFSSALLDTGQGIVYSYQTSLTDIEFDHCEFTAPNCGANGPSFYARINTTDTSGSINGLRIINSKIHDIGRVGCTIMNRNTSAGSELASRGIEFINNRVYNLGLIDSNGIGISLDGTGIGVISYNEFANNRTIAIENTGWVKSRFEANTARDFQQICSFFSWSVQGGRRISKCVIEGNRNLEPGNQRNNFIGLDDCRFSNNYFETTSADYAFHLRDSLRNRFYGDVYVSANAGSAVIGNNATTTSGNEWNTSICDNTTNGSVGTLLLFDGASTTGNIWRNGDLRKGTGGSHTANTNSAQHELVDVAIDGTRRSGYRILNMSDANFTLSEVNAQSRYLRFNGTLTAGRTVFFPDIDRNYVIHNSTAQTLTLDVGGVTTTIAAGVKATISWQKTSNTWYNFGIMT